MGRLFVSIRREAVFFIYDGEHGIYVKSLHPDAVPEGSIVAGDVVRVRGNTESGDFFPAIVPTAIERLGHEDLPDTRVFTLSELHDPKSDSDWVTVWGAVITAAYKVEAHKVILLEMDLKGNTIAVQVPVTPGSYTAMKQLLFRRVVFDAVAGSVYNTQRQLTGRVFYVNSAEDIQPIRNKVTTAPPIDVEIHEMMRMGSNLEQAIRTQGQVTYVSDSEFYLRGEEASLRVVPREVPALDIGEQVQVVGVAWPQPISPAFRATRVKGLGQAPAPLPRPVELGAQIDPELNYDLISLDVDLVNISRSFALDPSTGEEIEQVALLCRSGEHLFEAHLPNAAMAVGLESARRLNLTGICSLEADMEIRWMLAVSGLSLQLRGPDDLRVLSVKPWWTTGKLLSLLGILFAVLALVLIWAALLRRTVERQTSIIGQQIEHQTVLDERQRIARELHDNLEQGLAGMAIQLRGALRLFERHAANLRASTSKALELVQDGNEPLKEHIVDHLDVADSGTQQQKRALNTIQDMLKHCNEESRASIMDLRGGLLERMNLCAAIEVALSKLAEEGDLQLDVHCEGPARRLKFSAERNLLVIAREAATNAVRHGHPSHISVRVVYQADSLLLEIEDDGGGFDTQEAAKLTGHFGLVGMQERAKQIDGSFDLQTEAGKGTVISVSLPSLKEWERKT